LDVELFEIGVWSKKAKIPKTVPLIAFLGNFPTQLRFGFLHESKCSLELKHMSKSAYIEK